MKEDFSKFTNEECLRALCEECWDLGKKDSHRLYNPKNWYDQVLKRLNLNN